MTLFLKISVWPKLLETSLKNVNQARNYSSWSHRRPRRVITTAKEYDEIENRYEKNAAKINKKELSSSKEKVVELEHDELMKQLSHIKQDRSKWIPKTVQTQLPSDLLQEIDEKSEVADKSKPKKRKPKYKSVSDVENSSTDMLETVIDPNGDFVYTKLKDKDLAISQLMLVVKSRNEQIKKDLILLEGKRLIKEALETQCRLKNILFSRKTDMEFLKPYLPKSGAKLYKIPYREIQMWSDLTTAPGIMGIFKTPEIENFVSPEDNLNLTIICDNIREPGNLGAVLRTAAAVGAQNVLLTKGCVDLWDTKVLRSACGAHFRLRICRKMDWTDIKQSLCNLGITVLVADNNVITENIVESAELSSDNTQTAELKNLKEIVTEMPLLPYYGLNFGSSSHLVLIVGGETEGISDNSYRFAANFNGVRLNIPMSNNIESLNTGTALGIIVFEIKRQLALSNDQYKIEMQSH